MYQGTTAKALVNYVNFKLGRIFDVRCSGRREVF